MRGRTLERVNVGKNCSRRTHCEERFGLHGVGKKLVLASCAMAPMDANEKVTVYKEVRRERTWSGVVGECSAVPAEDRML